MAISEVEGGSQERENGAIMLLSPVLMRLPQGAEWIMILLLVGLAVGIVVGIVAIVKGASKARNAVPPPGHPAARPVTPPVSASPPTAPGAAPVTPPAPAPAPPPAEPRTALPAGWYHKAGDPADTEQWWDGTQWSEHTRNAQ